jgi:hypothetical protein
MKRTLLALALLLGTSGAFAQIGIKADALKVTPKTSVERSEIYQHVEKQKQNNGRKDLNVTAFCDFSDASAFTSYTSITGMGWKVMPDMNSTWGPENDFMFVDFLGCDQDGFFFFSEDLAYRFSMAPSGENGFAYLDMLGIWKAGMHHSDLEASMTFSTPLETYGLGGVDIYFNQYLMRFNNDRYFVDWSNDPTFATYDSIEINTRGVEMDVNTSFLGTKRVTLPGGTFNANAVGATEDQQTYIRLRATSPALEANANQPHGYFWIVDDMSYTEVPEDRVEATFSAYYANAYHIIPEGLQMDTLVHYSILENTGANAYEGAQVKNIISTRTIEGEGEEAHYVYNYHSENVSDAADLANVMERVIEYNEAEPPVPVDTTQQRYKEFYAWSNTLPSELGEYSIASVIAVGDEIKYKFDDTTFFEVAGPMVSNETHYRWAKDRDRAVEKGIFTYGWVYQNGYNYLTDDAPYGIEGYEVCLPFATNANNTTERYIKGVEVVPALDSCLAGSVIRAKLRMFNNGADGQEVTYDNMIIEVEDEWGIPVESNDYHVQASDLNNGLCTDPDYLDVIGPEGETAFNSIYMEFPNSVRLNPGDVYYACYQMAETGKFAVATDDSQLGTFGSGDGYWHSLMLVFQPNINARFAWGGDIYSPSTADGKTPMIRMILGTTASLQEEVALTSSLNAYPNPAANETTISYSLNRSGDVNIVITDIMGRTVKTMNQGSQVAGTSYNVNLNTTDLANGTYFYTLSVNGEKQTKKFVVNR